MKRKLLFVVGAGASIDFGMPSVAGVRNVINSEIQRLYPLCHAPSTNLYEHIEGEVRQHWRHHVPAYLRRDPHFEDLLYAVFALAAAYPAGVYTSSIGALIKVAPLPDVSCFGRQQKVDANILRHIGNESVDALLASIRKQGQAAEAGKADEFARLHALIAALQTEFEVAVVTLNYDNVMYRAFPGIETGFDPATGEFHERRILNRPGWPCMLHLHGSVHFDMVVDHHAGELHKIVWQPEIRASFQQNASGRSSQTSPEGASFPTSAIVAGYGKTTQTLRRPFRTYYAELDRLVANCDALLFAGYGFGDTHLNMAFESFRDSRRRPVTVIGFAGDDAMTMGGVDLGDSNPMIDVLVHTFRTNPSSMRALGSSVPDTVERLKLTKELEVSDDPDAPLSLWYNGLLEACANPGKVMARLR